MSKPQFPKPPSRAAAGTLRITTPSDRELALIREFAAPRERVFAALTTPALLRRWMLGPPGWTMPVCEIDLRVGGAYRYVWRAENRDSGDKDSECATGPGTEMGMGGVYREISPPDRIVHTEVFDQSWYEGEALVTTTLVERDGRTTLTTTVRYESKAARDQVLASPMESGVAAGYDRLEEILAQADRADATNGRSRGSS